MSADKHTAEDILMIKSGLEKVEFVRSQNYLAKLAVLISQQEKEIFKLQKKAHQHKVISTENAILKQQIEKLKNKLDK
jgi:cell division protein FtsB